MSRIQDILSKAERDGTARRTRALSDEYAARPVDDGVQARSFIDTPPPSRPLQPETPRVAPDVPRQPVARRLDSVVSPAVADTAVRQAEAALGAAASMPAYAPAIEGTPRIVAELDHHLVAALAPTSL